MSLPWLKCLETNMSLHLCLESYEARTLRWTGTCLDTLHTRVNMEIFVSFFFIYL